VSDAVVSCMIYVAGQAPNSLRAVQNLSDYCQKYLPRRHAVEIVDVFKNPERALAEKVLLTPTLVIVTPPRQIIVGDLSDVDVLHGALGSHEDRVR
jgi:circadian clock protein KaiB